MPEVVKLYKNLRDLDLKHMLYKTVEGLQIGAFNYQGNRGRNVDLDEIEIVFAIYDEGTDEYFVIRGGFYSKYSIGE